MDRPRELAARRKAMVVESVCVREGEGRERVRRELCKRQAHSTLSSFVFVFLVCLSSF